MEKIYPGSVNDFFRKHSFIRDDQDMYGKCFTGKELERMLCPKMLAEFTEALPDSPEAKMWLDHLQAIFDVYKMNVKKKLDPSFKDILARFESTFNVLQHKFPALATETLKVHIVVGHLQEELEDSGETMFMKGDSVVEAAHAELFRLMVAGNYKTKKHGANKDKKNLRANIRHNSLARRYKHRTRR